MHHHSADELTLAADVHFLRYYVGGDAVQPLPPSGVRDCPQDYPAAASASGSSSSGSGSSACVSAAPFVWDTGSAALPATAPIAIPTSEQCVAVVPGLNLVFGGLPTTYGPYA